MFDYQAQQIFVVQPRNTGGGLLSFLFSLDTNTASVDFKKQSFEQKLQSWNDFTQKKPTNAHVHGFINFGQALYFENLSDADSCAQYVHKHHFYEIFSSDDDQKNTILERMSNKQAIGLYLTESCVEKLLRMRPNTPNVDYYQLWMYANQTRLLKDFFNINCRHVFPFQDMLNEDILMDHLTYCRDLFDFDTGLDIYRQVIKQWHAIVL